MTGTDLLLAALIRAQAGGAVAVLLVLALRLPARRLIGAELAYRLWAVVPIAAVAALFPTRSEFVPMETQGYMVKALALALPSSQFLLFVWAAGAVAVAALFAVSEACYRRLVRRGVAGPAVMGVFWPRVVTPVDFDAQFSAAERDLIGLHERAHIARRDPQSNLLIAALQVLGWFNPLAHLAAACVRLDQELACDAAVVQARPDLRRAYGATLLKAHLARPRSPLVCTWPAPARHPLEVRLGMLARPSLDLAQYLRGAAAVTVVAAVAVIAVWMTGPPYDFGHAYQWTTIVLPGI